MSRKAKAPAGAPRDSHESTSCSLRDAEVLSRRIILASPKTLIHEVLKLGDGAKIDWYYVDTPSSVVIVPVTGDRRLVMIQQYRHNLKRDVLEFPAGIVRHGETLAAAALRELIEETGFRAAPEALLVLGRFYVLPSETNRYITIYLARAAEKVSEPTYDGKLERYFDIAVRQLTFEEAAAELGGAIQGLETMTALMLAREETHGT